ncbi:hypothetical protein BHE97_15480 [Aeromicrobium sp. PE09-221]|uniref:hypothetical protein n=1 Tax=Aeromicrobium sp. PE09-221 TaxID=1898043 RepID=UPI000B3E7E3F|nr:hypothetical protein [Aeromicrobium sp. PE09-221]OUZ07784.1 hypothetical protein BHE97_15480 [Aeromicrobium sp. PE09-221]
MKATTRWIVIGVLVGVGLAGWGTSWYVYQDAASQNAALIETAPTAEVQSQVTQALTQVLTYDYNDPEATEEAAQRLLAGDAYEEYETLYAALAEQAPDQQLTLTAQVQAVGVTELRDDRAEVLVFLDQSSRREGDEEASVSAAQIAVGAQLDGDVWTITDLRVL